MLTSEKQQDDIQADAKLPILKWYVKHGYRIFPVYGMVDGICACGDVNCKSPGKHPFAGSNGFKDATDDWQTVQDWHQRYPQANWGARTGAADKGGSGLLVVDIDQKNGGFDTWDHLRTSHSDPIETVSVATGNGGQHLFFKYPAGYSISSKTNALGEGIDVRANGGYVVIPPSITVKQYFFELDPANNSLQDAPGWILDGLSAKKQPENSQRASGEAEEHETELQIAIDALNRLKKERSDNYDDWLAVGMALHKLGKDGLIQWDLWSKQSAKYEPGVCAQKWETLTDGEADAKKISFGSLLHWAKEDSKTAVVKPCPKKAKPSDYGHAMVALGYKFSLNDMNDSVYVNDLELTDLRDNIIGYRIGNYGYETKAKKDQAIAFLANANHFHPIKDYLNSLEWTGYYDNGQFVGVDYIAQLASFFKDKDGVFPVLLRKWLIGAVERIFGRPGQQHPMLVLDGPQGIGKSNFVSWLGSPLPAYYLQSAIITHDKDFLIHLCSTWVWEVDELGVSFRKSDVDSLKSFISREDIQVRVPYGKRPIHKPATASFIGTINNTGGFLADQTGNRRYRVCTITEIDWQYDQLIDINQIWAQAVALFKAGERYQLDKETGKHIEEITSNYEVDDIIAIPMFKQFEIDPDHDDWMESSSTIIKELRSTGDLVGGTDNAAAQRVAGILSKLGCKLKRTRVNGQQVRVWTGVRQKMKVGTE